MELLVIYKIDTPLLHLVYRKCNKIFPYYWKKSEHRSQ